MARISLRVRPAHEVAFVPLPGQRIMTNAVRLSSTFAVAFEDGYPHTPGHTLVVPRRHETDLFALPAAERADVWQLVDVVREDLVAQLHPDGFTIGINVGPAAGQMIVHVHVIPRFTDDGEDPRGGIRWVLPERAPYWK